MKSDVKRRASRHSKKVRAVLRHEIAPLGHCYTLADAHIRVRLWHRVPVVLGRLSFLLSRPRKIAKPSQIPKLARAMRRRVLRNLNWCLNRWKLFPVASVDEGWEACVSRLVGETDVVVMHLSGISGNILWELDLLKRADRRSRTVFLVEADQRAAAEDVLARMTGISHYLC